MSIEKQVPLQSGFGPRTTAAEAVRGVDLNGKSAVVTGGYSGLGLETVRALAGAGAKVTVAGRSAQKADEALSGLVGDISFAECDLADLATVRKFASDYVDGGAPLHILINNAGVMACPETRIGPGWELQFGANHLGHFALTAGLMSALEKANGARVVALSSTGHKITPIRWDDIHFNTTPYDKWVAYGQSKTANALFANGLDRRGATKGVRAFAVHPGGIMTPLQRHLQNEEMVALGWIDKSGEISEQARPYFKSPEAGAATSVWCAVSPKLDGLGGVYCEDCDIAAPAEADGSPRGSRVAPWACDDEAAERLWKVSENMITAA